MAISSGLMMAGATMSSSMSQAEASRAQGSYQRQQGYLNAQLLEQQAQDATERGRADAATARRGTNATAGSQKVALAAQGLDLSEGSAAETIEQTRAVGAVQEMNIKTNAWREAWGYKTQAINERAEGDMAAIAAKGAAKQTLIAGGMQAISYGASGYRAAGSNSGGGGSQTRERTFSGNSQRASNRIVD